MCLCECVRETEQFTNTLCTPFGPLLMSLCVRLSVCVCIRTYAWMCVVLCMSPCIHVCHHVHTFVFATHLPVLDSVPVRAPCQNKRMRPGKSDMWTICLCRLTCVCVFLCAIACAFLDMCVCVCKPRRSLSPGSNLGLYRGGIRFLSPPHMCVSASMAVIETVGIVCVCLCSRSRTRVCDDRWHKDLSAEDAV